jgi:hypothetical protein
LPSSHGGAQDGYGRLPRGEELFELAPRGEVLGKARAQLSQAAEVHDARQARVLGRASEGLGHGPVVRVVRFARLAGRHVSRVTLLRAAFLKLA